MSPLTILSSSSQLCMPSLASAIMKPVKRLSAFQSYLRKKAALFYYVHHVVKDGRSNSAVG